MEKKMVSKDRGRKLVTLIGAMIILMLGISGTVAFFSMKSDTAVNTFAAGAGVPSIVEDFDGNVKQNVHIRNDGTGDMYVRAMVVVNWVKKVDTDGEGEFDQEYIWGTPPVKSTDTVAGDYYMDMNIGSPEDPDPKWVDDGTGIYYWTGVVTPYEQDPINAVTDNLINTCYVSESANVPDGYQLSVNIISGSIQAVPDAAVIDAWGEDAARILKVIE